MESRRVVEAVKWFLYGDLVEGMSCFEVCLRCSPQLFSMSVIYWLRIGAMWCGAPITQSPAFKFSFYANVSLAVYTLLTYGVYIVGQSYTLTKRRSNYYVHLIDMVLMVLVTSSSIAVTMIYYVSVNGNDQAGWRSGCCDSWSYYIQDLQIALVFSYLQFLVFLAISIISANKLRKIEEFSTICKLPEREEGP